MSQLQNFPTDSLQENQWVKMGAHHTLEIELNNKLTLAKERLRATLYDHGHDVKGRGKETSQYIDVHWCHISLCFCLPPNPILFCGSKRFFFSTRGPPALTCRIDGMPCTYKHWMTRPMCIRPLRTLGFF